MNVCVNRLFSAAALLAISACANGDLDESVKEAKYSADECRRTPLVDGQTGTAIVGAEDIALDPVSGHVFVSAYDRRATERAASSGAFVLPHGGLYKIELDELLNDSAERVAAHPIIDAALVPGGLRPHGLDYDPVARELTFVNRAYHKIDGNWRMAPRIERVDVSGEVIVRKEIEAPCAANDVLTFDDEALVSYDHGLCGWRAVIEDVLSLERSGVERIDAVSGARATAFSSAKFANGLVDLGGRGVALSDTKDQSIVFLQKADDQLVEKQKVAVPGGPDNLTVSKDGAVIAALHPSLLKIGAHRKLGFSRAPSRIVKIDPQSNEVSVLFNDSSGSQFSAATVAIEMEDALIVGSVTEPGLLVCQDKSEA